jgi:Ca-activated chloride channel family protein
MRKWIIALTFCFAGQAKACELALVLAVDISGSVDPREYRIQMDGLAEALRDDLIAEALVQAEARISLMHWTGSTRQQVVVPWVVIEDHAGVEALAREIELAPREWRNFSTAIGEALIVAAESFAQVTECERLVIDLSGDGYSNEGVIPRETRGFLEAVGITVNALAIEESEAGLSAYFRAEVIHGPGAFVLTAQSFLDYPRQIKRKLLREITEPIVMLQ